MNKEENITKQIGEKLLDEYQEDFKINVRTEIFHKLGFIKGYVGKGDDMKEVRDRVKEIEELCEEVIMTEAKVPVGTVDNTRFIPKVMAQCGHWSSNNSNICFSCIGDMWGFIKHKGLKEEFLKWNEETDTLEKHKLSKQEVDWIE